MKNKWDAVRRHGGVHVSSISGRGIRDRSTRYLLMQSARRLGTRAVAALLLALPATVVQAQAPVTGSLVTLVNTAPAGTFNQLERLSALGNQASYNYLTSNPR